MALEKIIINQDFIQQVEARAAEKLQKTQQLSLEDIATVLNIRRMEGMEFANSQSVRMFSPNFGIFTNQRSIMSAVEMSEYMKAGYIPHASSNTNFITVPILPFAIGGESQELFSSYVGAYEASKSAGMASGAFFIPLGDLRYLPNRFKGETTQTISGDIQKLISGVEVDSIVHPYMFKNRLTGEIQAISYMPIAGESSRNELLFSSSHWINKGTGKNDASSIKVSLTGYSYVGRSGQVEFIDATKKINGKYELPDDALPIFDVSVTLNNDTVVPSYRLDMRQLYEENTRLLQSFFQRADAEKIKANPQMIFDNMVQKSARLPDALFASRIKSRSYKGIPISDSDFFIDIETTPNISGKNYMTQFGFAYGESSASRSVYTPFSFTGNNSVDTAAALTTKFKNTQLDRITSRMLDIMKTGETGEDIIEHAGDLSGMISGARKIIGYNIKKFDLPQLAAAGVELNPNAEIVDVYEFISSHKRIVEEYFGVDFHDKLTLENVFDTLLKAGSVKDLEGHAHEAGYDVLMTRQVYRAITPLMEASKSDKAFTDFDRFTVLAGQTTLKKIVQANADVLGAEKAGKLLNKTYTSIDDLRTDFIEVLNTGSENNNVRTRMLQNTWKYSGGAISSIDVFDMADDTKGIRLNMPLGQQVSDIVEAIRTGNGKFQNVMYHHVKGNLSIGEDYSAIFRPTSGLVYSDVVNISFGDGNNYLRFTESIRDYIMENLDKELVGQGKTEGAVKKAVSQLLEPMMSESEMKPYLNLFTALYNKNHVEKVAKNAYLKKLYNSSFEWLINESNKPSKKTAVNTLEFMSVAFKNIVLHNAAIDESPLKPFANVYKMKAKKLSINETMFERIKTHIADLTSEEQMKLENTEFQDYFIYNIMKIDEKNKLVVDKVRTVLDSIVVTSKTEIVKPGDASSELTRFNDTLDSMVEILKYNAKKIHGTTMAREDIADYDYQDIINNIMLDVLPKSKKIESIADKRIAISEGKIVIGDQYIISDKDFDEAAKAHIKDLLITNDVESKYEVKSEFGKLKQEAEELGRLLKESDSGVYPKTERITDELDKKIEEKVKELDQISKTRKADKRIIEKELELLRKRRSQYEDHPKTSYSYSDSQIPEKIRDLQDEIEQTQKMEPGVVRDSKLDYLKTRLNEEWSIYSLNDSGDKSAYENDISSEEDIADSVLNPILREFGQESDVSETIAEKITEAGDQTIIKTVPYIPSSSYIFEDPFVNKFLKVKLLEENLITDQTNFSRYFNAFGKFYEAEMAIEASKLNRFQNMDPKSFAARMSEEGIKRRIAQEAWRDVRLFVSKRAGQSILDNIDAPNIYSLVRMRQLIDRQQLLDRLVINESNLDFGGNTFDLFKALSKEEKSEVYRILNFGSVNAQQRSADESSRLITQAIDASAAIEANYSSLTRTDAGKYTIKDRTEAFSEFIGNLKRQVDIISGKGLDLTTKEYMEAIPKISLHSSALHDSIEAIENMYEQWESIVNSEDQMVFEESFQDYTNNFLRIVKEVARDIPGIDINEAEDVANQLLYFNNQNMFFAKMYAGIDSVKFRGRIHKWSLNKDTIPELRAGAVITMKNNKQYTVEKMVRGVPILIDEEGHRVTFRAGIKGSAYSMISELVEYTGQPLGPIDQEYIVGATNMLLNIGMLGKDVNYAAKHIDLVSENVGFASREILDFLNRNADMNSESFFNFASGYANVLKGMGSSVPTGRLRVAEYIQNNSDKIFNEISKDPSRARNITDRMAHFMPDTRSIFVNNVETPNLIKLYNKLPDDIKALSDIDLDVSKNIRSSITKDLMNDYVYRSLKEGVDWRNVTRENLLENIREDSRLFAVLSANSNDLDKAAASLLEEDKGIIGLLEPLDEGYRKFRQLISNYNMAGSESNRHILESAIEFYRKNKDVDFQLLKKITYSAIRSGGFYETLGYGDSKKWIKQTGDTSIESLEQVYRLEVLSDKMPEASGLSPRLRNVMILAAGGNEEAQAEIAKLSKIYDLSFFEKSKPILEAYMNKMNLEGDERRVFSSYFYNLYEGEGPRAIHGGNILEATKKIYNIYSKDQEFLKLIGNIQDANVNKVAAALRSYNAGRISKDVMGAFQEYVAKNVNKLNNHNIDFLVSKLYDLSDGELSDALARVYGEGYSQVTGALDDMGKLLLAMDISRVISEKEYQKPGILARLFQSLAGRKESTDEILEQLGLSGLNEEAFRTMFGVEKAEASKIFNETAEGAASKVARKLPKISMNLKGILPGATITGGIIGLFVAIGAKARAEARHMEEEMRNTQMINTLSSVNLIANSMRYFPTEPEVAATMSVNGQENMDASGAMMSNLGIRNGYITYRS